MTKIIAIINQKGGVGKTTTSVNLSACLAVAEKRVLLIDIDPQGSAGICLGISKETIADKNIYNVLVGQIEMKDAIYKTVLPFLDICPSDNNLVGATIELVSSFARETKLKTALKTIENIYDYIIIDCTPSLGLLTVNALTTSQDFIVPMQTEFLAMDGLVQLLNTVKHISMSLNKNLKLGGILLTMFDSRSALHKQVAEEIKNQFGNSVFKTIIPRNVSLAEAQGAGQSIIQYDVKSKGAEAYLALAQEVLAKTSGLS